MWNGSLPVIVFSNAGQYISEFSTTPLETIIRNRLTRLAGTKARRAVRMIKIIQWFLLYNDRLWHMPAPASRLVGKAAEKREALCEITKKNLMLMKMPRSALSFSLSLFLSRAFSAGRWMSGHRRRRRRRGSVDDFFHCRRRHWSLLETTRFGPRIPQTCSM